MNDFKGELIWPENPAYERARRVFNALIDRRPALIASCRTASDVSLALKAAERIGGPVAVRGGGHSVAGYGVCDGGTVIDLSPMRRVIVDAERSEVHVEGGALWRDVDRVTCAHGLAVPGGVISSTGVGGFTLGGGLGWLSRAWGLACDNLVGATMTLADGTVVNIDEDHDSELLWAIRGGGGNFGVVTSFRFRARKISWINVLICVYPFCEVENVLRGFREVMVSAPDRVAAMVDMCSAEESQKISAGVRGGQVISVMGCSTGLGSLGAKDLAPLASLAKPSAVFQRQLRYRTWQRSLDASSPPDRYNYWKSDFIPDLPDSVIGELAAIGSDPPSLQSHIHVIRAGGMPSRILPDATALSCRQQPYLVHLISTWCDNAMTTDVISRTEANYQRIKCHASDQPYLNFIGDEGTSRIRKSYTNDTFAKLRAIKSRVDPGNLFHMNQNIPPLHGATQDGQYR